MHFGSRGNREPCVSNIAHQSLYLHGLARAVEIAVRDDLGVRFFYGTGEVVAGWIRCAFSKLQRRAGPCIRDKKLRVVSFRITSFLENCILYEPSDAVFISHGAGELDVLIGHGPHRHAGDGACVGHFCQTHDDGRRRSFLR